MNSTGSGLTRRPFPIGASVWPGVALPDTAGFKGSRGAGPAVAPPLYVPRTRRRSFRRATGRHVQRERIGTWIASSRRASGGIRSFQGTRTDRYAHHHDFV
ncbi:hypothetical protein GCM10010293_29020 [Streptomyces griseoflavus]|nr:hypothetical protein GCM10010293_29020 [Streptomyces griseoflavus]GGZ73628.1 hypothetical protein GCM10010301_54140 [Streptomyces plicatus]GHC27412.1 hypothetical protein GCM10010308_50420 [Streptomyces vinaceusdrappus]